MTDYTDIIARLETATGADRELDAVIMCAIGGARRIDDFTFYGPGEKSWGFGEHEDESNAWNGPLPYVTASLDAALALVREKLPGARWGINGPYDGGRFRAYFFGTVERDLTPPTYARTPALAVLLALFRALNHEET